MESSKESSLRVVVVKSLSKLVSWWIFSITLFVPWVSGIYAYSQISSKYYTQRDKKISQLLTCETLHWVINLILSTISLQS